MTRNREKHWVTGLLGVLLSACAGPRMLPPSDVTALPKAYEAVDRSRMTGAIADESFRLGPYAIGAVDRDWTSKKGFNVGGYGKSNTTTGYAYELSAGKVKHQGACGSETNEQSVNLSGNSSVSWGDTQLTCECGDAKLRISGKGSGLAGGQLELGGRSAQLEPITETDGGYYGSGPVGFRAEGDGKLLGAVELLYPGKVWLPGELAEADAAKLACLFVGAMLYVPPSSH